MLHPLDGRRNKPVTIVIVVVFGLVALHISTPIVRHETQQNTEVTDVSVAPAMSLSDEMANLLNPEDFEVALQYPRQCPIATTFAATAAADGCDCHRHHDFLDGRCRGRDRQQLFRRNGQFGIPSPKATWRVVTNCAWLSAVRPLVGHGFVTQVNLIHDPVPSGCPGEPTCVCWVHSYFFRSPDTPEPKIGGQRTRSWDDLPTVDTLFRSHAWLSEHIGNPLRPRLFAFVGHSFARMLFLAYVGVIIELHHRSNTRLRVMDNEYTILEVRYDTDADLNTTTLFRPVAMWIPSPAPVAADLAEDSLRTVFRLPPNVSLAFDVILFFRGIWEQEKLDGPTRFILETHAHVLVQTRRQHPRAVILTYLPHYPHVVHGGCGSWHRLVELRDALVCAVAMANKQISQSRHTSVDRSGFTEVFDVFDITATRRYNSSDPATRLAPLFTSLKPSMYLPPDSTYLPVGDGIHFDAPLQFNVVLALVIQAVKSPLWSDSSHRGTRRGRLTPSSSSSSCAFSMDSIRSFDATRPTPLPPRFQPASPFACRECVNMDMSATLGINFFCELLRYRRRVSCSRPGSVELWANAPAGFDALVPATEAAGRASITATLDVCPAPSEP